LATCIGLDLAFGVAATEACATLTGGGGGGNGNVSAPAEAARATRPMLASNP
jgi:hypothetical protein